MIVKFEWSAFRNMAYKIFKIKLFIFMIFYIIINKYINNYFKRNNIFLQIILLNNHSIEIIIYFVEKEL